MRVTRRTKRELSARRRTARDACKSFLRQTSTLSDAKRLARSRGFSAATSVWLGAMGELLSERHP